MRRWVVPVFVALAAFSTALPAKSVDRVKRADETVMFGNQQNLAHKSVKKSGPPPMDSKLAEKKAEVAASHVASEDDPVQELADMMNSAQAPAQDSDTQPEKDLHTLISKGDSEVNAPLIEEEKKLPDETENEVKKKVDINLGQKPKRAEQPITEDPAQRLDDAQYFYLLNKYGPAPFMVDREVSAARRRKRAAAPEVSNSRLNRIRRDLSKMASESHMSATSQHRKKRDVDMDPNQLAMLEYMLSRSNDGYETPEEVIEPTYMEEEVPVEYEPEPPRDRRGMLDDYSRYAVAKRVPDDEPEAVEEEEMVSPMSVYESEYGPVAYGLIDHEGVPGLFVPLQQESMKRLLAAEEQERDDERSRLRTLATILSLNQRKRK